MEQENSLAQKMATGPQLWINDDNDKLNKHASG